MSVLSDRALQHVDHLHVDDPDPDGLLDALTEGQLAPADRLSLVAHGDGTSTGPWQAITDPATAPLWGLPHAGLYTGAIMPKRLAGETDTTYETRARDEITHPRGMLRGSAQALRIAALAYVTGTQTVRIIERPDDDPWRALVIARPSEVPDQDALTAAVNDPAVILAGMRADVELTDDPLINEGTRTVDTAAVAAAIDTATLADVT